MAVILLILFVACGTMSSMSLFTLLDQRAFTDNGKELRENVLQDLLWDDVERIHTLADYSEDLRPGSMRSVHLKKELDLWFDPHESNLRYTITDETGAVLYQNEFVSPQTAMLSTVQTVYNNDATHTISQTVQSIDAARQFEARCTAELQPDQEIYDVSWEWQNDRDLTVFVRYYETQRYYVDVSVVQPLTAHDKYFYAEILVGFLLRHRYTMILSSALSLGVVILLLLYLVRAAGHQRDLASVQENFFDRIPFDLFLLLIIGLIYCSGRLLNSPYLARNFYLPEYLSYLLVFLLVMLLHAGLYLWLILSFATRCKTGHLLRNTILARAGKRLVSYLRFVEDKLPAIWRGILLFVLITVLEGAMVFLASRKALMLIWVLEKLVLLPVFVLALLNLHTLEKGSQALNDGSYDSKISLRGMLPGLRRHAENLNGISRGMQSVLEKNTRSERMKAELITNVSHDIKTPLTSIINYVNLLQREDITPQEREEYLQVLDRQSSRMKKLIVDLVEASKASTGNTPVEPEPTDINLLLTQAAGEYEDRMSAHALTLSYDLAEQSPQILADPKLLWRVLDNLLNNALKYSQPATRVYLSTRVLGDKVEIIFRNVSSQPLNIAPEELLARFVRGRENLNTEGSGLGLSIAQNLTALQGGTFQVDIDGDLFKVTLGYDLLPAQ